MQLVVAAARGKHQPVKHALHAARNAAVINRRSQYNAVGRNALLDDLVDHVPRLHAAQRAVVQAVITGHAGLDVRAGLKYLKRNAFPGELLCHHVQTLCGVAALSGRPVNRNYFHIRSS